LGTIQATYFTTGARMTSSSNTKFVSLKQDLIEDMTNYMKFGGAEDEKDPDFDPEFEAGYTQEHVDRCGAILDTFLASLAKSNGMSKNQDILKAVKIAVLALNKLNDQCDGSLIETDQREQLCEFIITATKSSGLETTVYDITEEWREW
jgi:hypothetical protein